MKYDVFISYSRKDKEVVNEFASKLKSHGYNIWMDVDGIESGDAFKVKIVNAIRNSSLFLFFSSKASNESEWTVKEVNVAVNMHKPIIPIKLDDCIYNDSILFDLSGMDYIDVNIDGDLKLSVERVLRSIKKNISEEPDSYKNNKDENKDAVVAETVKLNSLNHQNDNIQENTTNVFYDAAERYYKMGEDAEDEGSEEEAIKWYLEAAKLGNFDACYRLGECYYCSGDYDEALEWYSKAIEDGTMSAEEFYEKAEEVDEFEWYMRAAEQGHSDAQYKLGECYNLGFGVKADEAEAVKWYRKAAEQGHSDAQNELGNCFYFGSGIEADEAEAVKWYMRAAEQGNSDAQYQLGECYNWGFGIEENKTEATKWYMKAAEQGHSDAIKALELPFMKKLYLKTKNWFK